VKTGSPEFTMSRTELEMTLETLYLRIDDLTAKIQALPNRSWSDIKHREKFKRISFVRTELRGIAERLETVLDHTPAKCFEDMCKKRRGVGARNYCVLKVGHRTHRCVDAYGTKFIGKPAEPDAPLWLQQCVGGLSG
jgi:hypothetical protein